MRISLILIIGLAATIRANSEISGDEAMRTCRNEIRQTASHRFGASNIEFRSTQLDENQGQQDSVRGTFAVRQGEKSDMHTFACSVDLPSGSLQWAKIDSQNIGITRNGSPQAATFTDAQMMERCQQVVRRKIFDHGYIGARPTSIKIEKRSDRSDRVAGTATGETAGHRNEFQFSCEISPNTGIVQSVTVNGH